MALLATEGKETKPSAAIIADRNKRLELKRRAEIAGRQAEDAKSTMQRAKMDLSDAIDASRRNPSYANLIAVREAAGNYQTAALDYLGALYTMELANNAAGHAGISIRPAAIDAGQKISPAIDAVKSEMKKAESQYRDAAKSQTAAPAELKTLNAFESGIRLEQAAAQAQILYDIARLPQSTSEDGHNLVAATAEMAAAKKSAYVGWRDQFIADAVAKGASDQEARNAAAKELRERRREQDRTGERAEYFEIKKKSYRLGSGLIRGDVQTGRTNLPAAIDQHHDGKRAKKSARLERALARDSGDVSALQKAVSGYSSASIKMTLGIFNQLTAELMTEGYTHGQARALAKEKFRAEHESRKYGNDKNANEWRQSWAEYRKDVESLNAAPPSPRIIRHQAEARGNEAPGRHRTDLTAGQVRQRQLIR